MGVAWGAALGGYLLNIVASLLHGPDVVLLASVLNTEGERASQAALLGLVSGKRSRPLTLPLRKVPRHTFEQLRLRLEALQRESRQN